MLPFDDARFAAYLRRLTGAKGGAALTQLLDAMPVVALAGDREEDAFLRDERMLMARQDSGPVAAQYSGAQFEMNCECTIAVVYVGLYLPSAGAYLTVGPAATIGASGTQVQPADTRVANSQGTHTRANITGVATAAPVFSSRSPIIAPSATLRGPFILFQARLYVEATAVNDLLQVNFFWREFRAPPANR